MTSPLVRTLIVSTALAILSPLPACAGASDSHGGGSTPAAGSTILNGQVTFGAQWSTLNTTVNGVNGDVIVQGQAAGNVLDAVTFDDTHVNSNQDAESTNIGSEVTAGVSNVGGSVGISSTAFCNSTDISTDPAVTAVKSNQYCGAQDPGSTVTANVNNVYGDASIASSAYGNTFMEDTNALSAPTQIRQTNTSNVFSTATANVANVGGSVAVTSSAVGNHAQIVHYTDNTGTSGQ